MSLAEGNTNGIEWSIHKCPASIRSEVKSVLPSADIEQLLIIPTCQRSVMDLVNTGEAVAEEKDALLEKFFLFAQRVIESLPSSSFSDYIDPCSGLAMIHKDSTAVYSEVDALSILRGFKTSNAGCCKVLLHPQWGSSVYPATLMTTAPLDLVLEAIAKANV